MLPDISQSLCLHVLLDTMPKIRLYPDALLAVVQKSNSVAGVSCLPQYRTNYGMLLTECCTPLHTLHLQCCKLRAELAAAKREAASWRARWERDCTASGGISSSGAAGMSALQAAGSSAGGLDGALARASSSGMTAAAFEFGLGRRASRASNTG
jgi:hypothetical protein